MSAKQMSSITLAGLPDLVGAELGVSDWVEIAQGRIDAFAAVTEDRQWIHVDRERAAAERGGTIAHGFLSLSLLSVLRHEIFRIPDASLEVNYGFDRVRFTDEVPAGSRIRLRLGLGAATWRGSAMQLSLACRVEREGAERPVLVADWLTLAYPAGAERA